MPAPDPTLSIASLRKGFGPNLVVDDVSFAAHEGQVVALVGCNGAGKSTLLKMIYGTLRPDAGHVLVDGSPLEWANPRAARAAGVEMVFQDKDEESKLCPRINVVENLFLGREPTSLLGIVKFSEMRGGARRLMDRYQFPLPPLDAPFAELSGGQQKAVAIGRALLSEPRVLLLDEPTASLGVSEQRLVHDAIGELKVSGVAILLCSHSLTEVEKLADRVIALRGGRVAADKPLDASSEAELAILMSK